MLTFEQIKELVELVDERGLAGLEIERSGFRLKIEGGKAEPVIAQLATPVAPQESSRAGVGQVPAVPSGGSPGGQELATEAADEDSELPEGTHMVTSPIVGTFYSAPSPDADAYVKVGDRIEKGQVLCIIEAMKLMNEIESDVDGKVLEIYPKNAQAVEFGEPLFAIETS